MALTEQQKKFADNYIMSGNATQSYLDAGYKVKDDSVARANASRLLTNANVLAYIQDKQKVLQKATIATQEEILEFWTNTMREIQTERRDRLKASEYLAKSKVMFTDKLEVSGKDGGPIQTEVKHDLSKLSIEELSQLEDIINKTSNDRTD